MSHSVWLLQRWASDRNDSAAGCSAASRISYVYGGFGGAVQIMQLRPQSGEEALLQFERQGFTTGEYLPQCAAALQACGLQENAEH